MTIDDFVFHVLDHIRSPLLNSIARDITSLGSLTLIVVQGIIAGFVLVLGFHDENGPWRLGIAAGGTQLWVEVIKRLWRRARPAVIKPLIEATGFSFPSGHAATAAAFYLSLAFILNRHLKTQGRIVNAVAATLIALVALSRVYLGVHYASDVLGGIVLGAGWAFVTARLTARAR